MDSKRSSKDRDTILEATPAVKALLRKLHSENAGQERSLSRLWYQFTFALYCLRNWDSIGMWNEYHDLHNTDQLLSHSREKCKLIYMLACLNNTKHAVECGTSYGVSSIYLALAIQKNLRNSDSFSGGVITMEKDLVKATRARSLWHEAGEGIEKLITLHEGDLLQTLKDGTTMPEIVDLLFLDAWTSQALPALKLVLPRLRHGSLVFVDKTTASRLLYQEFLDFVRDPGNNFMSATIPFTEGFEVIVYELAPRLDTLF